ncbi:MAG: DUF5686 family protein, partial [Bacteroidales bacterium]|nr:DUF5686 family protein [Bacteroidales bacterium]
MKRQFSNIAIEVAPDATDKGDNYWLQYRIDSLNQRTAETYRYMDSIGQAHNFDRIAASLQTLQSGRIPIKMFDLNLDKLLGYNAYEGIYAGLGLQTNDKFSRAVKFGGFWGYGFRDQTAKYGLDVAVQIDRYKEISLEAAYSFEALESGGFTRFGENPFLIEQSKFRDFFINRKDITTTLMGGISFRALRHFKWRTFIEVQEKTNKTGYVFAEAGKLPTSTFRFTKLQLQTRFVFKEKFMQTTRGLISLGSSYPIVRLAYTKSFDDLLDGAYAFDKWEFKTNYAWFTPYLGKTDITLIAGLVEGNAPGTELFNASGTYRAFTFYAPESFGTMRTNEFLSDKFTALFFTHNFGKLLFRKGKFEPEFVLAT